MEPTIVAAVAGCVAMALTWAIMWRRIGTEPLEPLEPRPAPGTASERAADGGPRDGNGPDPGGASPAERT